MTAAMLSLMIALLLLGFPMMIPLIGAAMLGFFIFFAGMKPDIMIQQMIGGIKPAALIAVPMFIFAADIITKGHSADRLLDLVMKFVGHVRGGLAVTSAVTCTLFGAVSGSTQATVVAVGGPLRPKMLQAGYNDSFVMALIINASDIAFLIPPSIGMIIYGVVSGTSIAELFIAGIGPGLLILLMFATYSVVYAKINDIPIEPRSNWSERWKAARGALWPLGFPVIIVGGIYGGIFSPTEAASVSVLYALFLELLVFRSLKIKDIPDIALSTGLITAVVFILVAAGTAFSWTISFAQIPQAILGGLGLDEAGPIMVLVAISIAFFVGCMFVDPIVVILVLAPIFAPVVAQAGLDPVHVGIIITLQVAIGSATPPFGCDIFTAIAIFRRPYFDVIKGTPPFFLMLLIAAVLLIFVPDIALFLRDMAFGD
ncbi:MAG: TRAP transporter large permease [Gammaproteobacteria bacterium]|nr:TRAP transporter large permease [Gammaproteobacteria bacterium]NIR82954.1 TRAP transporter large permease [Gammaproteobacteria bacterium]NIR90319.1 TRAP transporter large permease [Gammaproteobacteria bacterium]NIU04100.1 TRAP transporter large permease [Gammaproteobacteria bacterium]NIV51396.1 TRAP transporter large permease subunit [Gammaproteobacteria bacterium]